MNATESLRFFLPEMFLVGGAFGALFLDFFVKNKKAVGIFSLAVLLGTALLAKLPEATESLFFGFFTLDPLTHYFRLLALAVVAVTILTSFSYRPLAGQYEGEYYSLFLFMAFGLILMGASTNLLMILLSVEFVSVLSYLLVGFLKKDIRAKEAAVKYLLFGSLATGVMLYGMSLLFGASGSLEISEIQRKISEPAFFLVTLAAMIFFLTGLGFKISMAPFHLWAPDVYEGAPTPVTAFLTVAPKALGFAVLVRVLTTLFLRIDSHWEHLISILSILTMTIGNVTAISQTHIKRLLAYSSIAQAGYILMGLAAYGPLGLSAVLIYLAVYAVTNLGAFIVVVIASNHFGNDEIASYAGLAERSPLLAASLTLFLLSLAGIPPLAGFIGKFFVFSSALDRGMVTLAVAAALNSAVAAYYYFRVVRMMYLAAPAQRGPVPQTASLTLALFLTLAGTLLLGVVPAPLIAFVKEMILT